MGRTHHKGRHARPLTRTQRWKSALGGVDGALDNRFDIFTGPLGVLRLLAACALGLGFGYLPFDAADHQRAMALSQHGRTVTVSDVRVHVDHVHTKGGGWYEVDRVQVHIPGVDQPWVDVYGLVNLELNEADRDRRWVEGWQAPTSATSYRPPMDVTYRVGRNVDAMTPGDIAAWRTSDEPQISAAVGGAGALAFAATFAPVLGRRLRNRAGDTTTPTVRR